LLGSDVLLDDEVVRVGLADVLDVDDLVSGDDGEVGRAAASCSYSAGSSRITIVHDWSAHSHMKSIISAFHLSACRSLIRSFTSRNRISFSASRSSRSTGEP